MNSMNNPRRQRGGTFLGFILGLVIGLGVALGVAMYVTKVPTPFSNKNQTRSPEQDVVESQKNKDWNPNGVLQPKAPASAPVDGTVTPLPAPATVPAVPAEAARKEVKPAVSADPLGDLAKSKAAGADVAAEPFQYFVQVGAYRTQAEAEAQKAKMAMMGLEAKVSEREQAGRTVYRVRLGPFDDKAAAERVRTKLESAQVDNAIVRMQR
ncbi:SPOR domain-containing protein [Limnohabitans sp.]|jgi:cell division protein FtsN|uniref:SPOR domain-containing protein n=1 Tax=Limnohabitans sp. TaxID=1907725 RepID=UPI0035B1C761